ncbi:MAG TPA: SIS domain-containing protein [Actinomycetota bacterium]|jgi:glutamine---fructose-6-phosphate transaminase (isomerizing)|nr:SIS domain-containing protein [Actinomycetota bacterium]
MKWLGKFPDPFLAEIAGQPEALRRAAVALEDQRSTLVALAGVATDVRGVVLTGMGSSYDACFPAVNELARRGVLALHIDSAELLHFRTEVLTPSTVLVVVSQSGESAEVVRLADSLVERADRPTILSITNGLDNALAARSDLRLDTRAGPERGPSTMTFAASMTQLSAVAGAIAGDPTAGAIERARAASEEAATAIEQVLDHAEVVVDRFTGAVRGRHTVAVLGRGPARAAAEMGALTLKENGVMAEAFSTAAFRHGPFELAGQSLAAIIVATELETRSLDLRLAEDLVLAGASVTVIGPAGEALEDALEIPIDATDRALVSAASLVPIQLLSWRLASELGRDPGVYLRASKVTTRE